MYLSNRDIKWAIECGKLIVDPRPEDRKTPRGEPGSKGYDETSIDLHLGPLSVARIWDLDKMRAQDRARGHSTGNESLEMCMGTFDWDVMVRDYLKEVPEGEFDDNHQGRLVFRRSQGIVVAPTGFYSGRLTKRWERPRSA